jgi:hypothetical protein
VIALKVRRTDCEVEALCGTCDGASSSRRLAA